MWRRFLLAVALVGVAVGVNHPIGAREGGDVTGHEGAPAYGSTAAQEVTGRMVALAATPTGLGYWQVADNGDVYAFGDARFAGSVGAPLNRPIVGMAATPTGLGYWLVASDGGIFSFGDATFLGSTGAVRLNQPIVGMAATPTGRGYWLVASDGGIFTFGDAVFAGSGGGTGVEDAIGMGATLGGGGYWIATATGRVLAFGDAADPGMPGGECRWQPVVAIATRRSGGFWLGSGPFPPASIPYGADPIAVVAAESANLASILRVRQGCEPDAAPARGRFSSPLPGSHVTSSFGQRIHPVYRRPQLHTGMDLAGGTSILAAADGVVVHVAEHQGYGLVTIVDHGDGTGTVYGHQAAVAVREGDHVARGQRIGTVGHSGYATGNHLHFEVRVHGVPTNPALWL